MKRLLLPTLVLVSLTLSTSAFAYVGPGAGLTLLGALWGLIAAVGAALLFIIGWPIRKMLRKNRAVAQAPAKSPRDTTGAHVS